jgi:hypothetical protein
VIQFLYWDECPSHEEALQLLRDVLGDLGRADEPIEVVEVRTDKDAARLGFRGSPTILVDGRDIDRWGGTRVGSRLTCRIYHLPDGRPSPVPSRQQLEEALEA